MIDAEQLDDDRVMNLVDLALAREPEERRSYLESACSEDALLFAAVWNYVESESRMNGYLLKPLFTLDLNEKPFEPGERIDNRFRIIREVGRGGMGVVYEAVDEKVDRRIAIKCAKAGFRRWLSPEVRNASEIHDPHVCRIYDIHTASTARGQTDFISMEFLDGLTLDQRLRTGALTKELACNIARQLCSGLAEAHRKGVIHGDLKSNNVFLTEDKGTIRAVITDFGLARRPGSSPGGVQGGVQSAQAGGAPDYMAPELWKGGKPSFASDVYAMGVILYELATGRRPHPPRTPWEERLTRKAPPVDSSWDRILACCLHPDPKQRFQDAQELSTALAPARKRWPWVAGAVAALLLAATPVVTYLRMAAPKESVRLALAPFESDAETAFLVNGLSSGVKQQLAKLKSTPQIKFGVVPFPQPDATQLLQGTLRKEKSMFILHAWLTDTRTKTKAKEWTGKYTPEEFRFAPVAIAGLVTETFHLPPVEARPWVSEEAHQSYLKGLKYTRQNSTMNAALPLLKSAVAAEPDSALAYAGLAEAQWFKQEPMDRLLESIRCATIRNPDLAPVHRIAGLLMENTSLYDDAIAEYKRAIELDPANSDAYRRLGHVFAKRNQKEQAHAAFLQALKVEPTYYKPYQDLGAFYSNSANYAEAIQIFRKMIPLAPAEHDPHNSFGIALVNSGQFSEARSEFETALGIEERPTTLMHLGQVFMYQKAEREALKHFARAVTLSPNPSSLMFINLGTAWQLLANKQKAQFCYRRGLLLADAEMSKKSLDGTIRARAAYLYARLGQRARAVSEIGQALQQSPGESDTLSRLALTYEVLKRRQDTIAILRLASHGTIEDLSRWPEVADLWKDPSFQELLAKKQ